MYRTIRMLVTCTSILFLFIGCNNAHISRKQQDCNSSIRHNVKGLVIQGPRPKQNVIENMTPIVCSLKDKCLRENHADLKGKLLLKMTVNRNGELGVLSYEHTMKDSAYVQTLVESIYLFDFDPWNDEPEDTEFEYPVVLFE